MGKILAYLQSENGTLSGISLESFYAAQLIAKDLDYTLTGVVLGENMPEQVTSLDMTELLQVRSPQLNDYTPEVYVESMNLVLEAEKPDILLAGHTYQARDWLPRLAGKCNLPMISDCIGYRHENDIVWIRQVFQGKINADVRATTDQVIVSFQSGSYRSDKVEPGSPQVRAMDVDLSQVTPHVRPEDKFQESKGTVDLSRAERIVSIGRGIGDDTKMDEMNALAAALGAELGSSRPVVDYGWLEHDRQVGSSGQTVSPKLYIAVGISGAIQHQVGMKNSGCIVAINKDANAPIFEIADYGIVADLFDIVPRLTTALTERSGG